MEMCRRHLMKRGGANRFPNKQSGSGFTSKSKKRMLKKLSLANEMGFELPSSDVSRKKSKSLRDTNGVDHASVPRKLRSAMKKRNLESVSKRLNESKTRTESSKENQEMEAKATGPESMMISKDEKEVAETLYGLAGMFTATDSIDKNTCEAKETSQVDSILVVEDDLTKAEPFEPAVSVLSSPKTKLINEIPLEKSDKQLSSTRLKQSSSLNVTDAPARAIIEEKVATSDMDYNSNGLALWPGLSSTVQSGSNVLLKPTSNKLPSWMGQAVSPSKSESLRVKPIKLKKCASHVYISRLIKVLQTSISSPMTLNKIEQISSERGLSDPVTTISDLKTMVSPSKRYQTSLLLDLHKTQNLKSVQEDMTQLALELPNPHTSQIQSYDFLSLSCSGATHSHFPFPQYHISAAHNSQLSPATSNHQQLSPYIAREFQTAYNSNHHHQQLQQQQQQLQKRLWGAQYRPTSVPSSNQYSKPDLSLNLTSIQPPQVTSSPRYNNNVSQQQHRLMAAMSMSHHHNTYPSRMVMNRREHYLPLIYEDSRTSIQLLCEEQS